MKKFLKKIGLFILMSIILIPIFVFWIWAEVSGNKWMVFVLLALIITGFFIFGFLLTWFDKKKELKEQKKPPNFTDEILGDFRLDQWNYMKTNIKWCGNDIKLEFFNRNEEEIKLCIETARELFNNQEKWKERICAFAAEELTETANDWNDSEDCEISEEEFKSRIDLSSIRVDENGDFTFWFYDDNMFADHTVEICGNIKSGPDRADLLG